MKSAEIRQAFLKYFESKGHTIVESSSLVPGNDPTLLFTNAGMVQFKDVFLGSEKRNFSRATSSQRCVRAGGKHNDLENVGYTARHHTLFEMLGNFSFGDYFKRDAIKFAWEFLTETLKLPPEKLWVTVHISDDEAADIWLKEVGVSSKRFSRLDEDNFWQMGDTGPCGPSSEIFYDHGEDVPGGPPGSENDDLDRYIEIWNLVFMQFERQASGELIPLPKPSVDTGMGLERVAAVLQGVHSNYEIDLFTQLLKATVAATNAKDTSDKSLRVIADHIRSCSFLVADGVLPSNEGRGYVLRRIMRRAIRHGYKLGQKSLFFYKIVAALVEEMGEAYPLIKEKQEHIEQVIKTEEEQFARTLEKGLKILEAAIDAMGSKTIPGDVVFKLHDTYGFPVDLTNDIARERGLTLDMETYEELMKEQQEKSGGDKFALDYTARIAVDSETTFEGYDALASQSTIEAIFKEDEAVEEVSAGDDAVIVLPNTPFYANSGGQVGDVGTISTESGAFNVVDCRKQGDSFLHIGQLTEGTLAVGERVNSEVSANTRLSTALNHSATHLLHAALRKVLGEHVTQKGSLVDAERLRFDFAHFQAMTAEEIAEVEHLVNAEIRNNTEVLTEICDMNAAKEKGAMALFGEKYGDTVRVLSMGGDFSIELCGGTHVKRTGDIGVMHIIAESGIAAGVRRIEALTGEKALASYSEVEQSLNQAAKLIKSTPENLIQRLETLVSETKTLEKALATANAKLATASADSWLSEAEEVGSVKVLAKSVEGVDGNSLVEMSDKLKSKLGSAVVLLAGIEGDKVALVAGVSKDISKTYKAGDLIKYVAAQLDGKGGGRPDMARGAGVNSDKLPEVLSSVSGWVAQNT